MGTPDLNSSSVGPGGHAYVPYCCPVSVLSPEYHHTRHWYMRVSGEPNPTLKGRESGLLRGVVADLTLMLMLHMPSMTKLPSTPQIEYRSRVSLLDTHYLRDCAWSQLVVDAHMPKQ